jgi:hypothetical protein
MTVIIDGTAGITFPNSSTQLVAGAPLVTPSFTTTIGVGAATASASGAGITFPATQSASSDANTLDDYEEGTWTATVTPQTSGTISLSAPTGSYTKIGRQVFCSAKLTVGSVSSPTGYYKISLPFSISGGISGAAIVVMENTTSTGCTNFWNILPAGDVGIGVYLGGGTNPTANSAQQCQAGSTMWFTASYQF